MGRTAHELIPAAILLDNPGITREELSERMHATRNYSKSIMHSPLFSIYYHQGLHGVAEVLSLPESMEYRKLMNDQQLSEGIKLCPPTLYIDIYARPRRIYVRKNPRYKVTVNVKNSLEQAKEVHLSFHSPVEVGEIVEDYYHSDLLVLKILNYNDTGIASIDPHSGRYEYTLMTRELKRKTEEHEFRSIEDLVKAFPFFDPDFKFDFSQENGKISTGSYWSEFYWKKNGSKYYLDEKTFDRIPETLKDDIIINGKERRVYGYTDLILTAEALKNRWWSCLNLVYKPGILDKRMKRMFKRHPESRARHEQAVWDSFFSAFAKNHGLTHTELMRWRLLCNVKGQLK